MGQYLSWEEIKKKYPNMWVAISNFSTDDNSPTNSQGEVYAHASTEEELATILPELDQGDV